MTVEMPPRDEFVDLLVRLHESQYEEAVDQFLTMARPDEEGGEKRAFTLLWSLSVAVFRMLPDDGEDGPWIIDGPIDEAPPDLRLFLRWMACAGNDDVETGLALWASANEEGTSSLAGRFLALFARVLRERVARDTAA